MSRYPSGTRAGEEGVPLLSSELHSAPQYDVLESDPQLGGHEAREKLESSFLRKLDIRMSILVAIYILNYIDRNSAAAARLRGFEDDLGLEGTQFASILSIFYVGYIFVQIPSNMFLSQIGRPSVYLPCCTIIWGAISFCTGLVTSYYGALLTRFLLGLVEAAFYPGTLFLITKWYKRSELSQRMALFACGSFISNAFGSLIASGILGVMDGVFGYAAWRWLFFVEGGLTVLVAAFALFILPDFPETKSISWLTPAEHALARRRMVEDAAGAPHTKSAEGANQETWHNSLMMALTDWKVWYLTIAVLLQTISSSFFMYFPTLAATMGYNPTITLLLCAPPWLIGAIWVICLSRHSDRIGERCMHTVASFAVGIAGFLLAMSSMHTIVRYISLFLMTPLEASSIFLVVWASSTVSSPPTKRAAALAIINALSQSGNVIGSYVWPKSWGPTYNKSYAVCITTSLICIMMCLWLRKKLKQLNKEMELAEESGVRGRRSGENSWRYHL